MRNTIWPLVVKTTENNTVIIETPDLCGNNYSVEILPNQIDILIDWLNEAKEELEIT